MWFALIMAAGSAYSARGARKQQNELADKQFEREQKYTDLRNEATLQAAVATQSRINVENASLNKQVTSALISLRSSKLQAASNETANQAASGAEGASAQAALLDIEREADRAQAGIEYNRAVAKARLSDMEQDVWAKAAADQLEGPIAPNLRGRSRADFLAVAGAAFQGYQFGSSVEPASTSTRAYGGVAPPMASPVQRADTSYVPPNPPSGSPSL